MTKKAATKAAPTKKAAPPTKAKAAPKKATAKKADAKKTGSHSTMPFDVEQEVKKGPKPEIIKQHFDQLVILKKRADSAAAAVRSQKALAKKDGLNTVTLAKCVTFAARDTGEVEGELGELGYYMDVCCPSVQLEMFEDKSKPLRLSQIFDDGLRAGLDAKRNLTDNPHGKGTPANNVWADAYAFGQRQNANVIGKTPEPEKKLDNPVKDSHGVVADGRTPTSATVN